MILSSFFPRKPGAVIEYQRYFHSRSYLWRRSQAIANTHKPGQAQLDLMKSVAYAKYHKFRVHRDDWDTLNRKVPLAYLAGIGVNRATLEYTFELDCEEYEVALAKPISPRHFIIRIMPAVYADGSLPEGLTEIEAIEHVKEYMAEKPFRCSINVPDLKTIYIERDGSVATIEYRPTLEFTKHYAYFGQGGHGIGVTRIR